MECSGVFLRPLPVPRAALLVLRAGVLCLLIGRIGWLLMPVMPSGAGDEGAAELGLLGSSVVDSLGRQFLGCLLVAFYATCAYLVAATGLVISTGWREWVHDRAMPICSVVLFATGLLGGDGEPSAHWAEQLATALLPVVWVLTRRSTHLRARALGLARMAVVLGFVAHGLLFFAWQDELPLLGHLLVADLELGSALTGAIMLGLFALYAGLGSLIALGAWLRGIDRVVLGGAVTLGAFTAGIRICLGLEPGFFQATAAHWLFSTLLGSALGCLPLFMALCVDQRLVALGGLASPLVSPARSARRPGPRSAA